MNLTDLGQLVKYERLARGMSIESSGQAGSLSHMTWRRIERGLSVQSRSYLAVDKAFGFQHGTAIRVLERDEPWPDSSDDADAAEIQESVSLDVAPTAVEYRSDPVLMRAGDAAPRALGDYIGRAVGAVLMDHSLDEHPDPNIHELAHCVLVLASIGKGGA